MSKKLITAALALVALAALALPAVSSATNDPDLTHPTGTLMGVHLNASKTCAQEPAGCIDAHSLGVINLTDSSGNLLTQCTNSTFTGRLTKNDGSNVEGDIESSTFTGSGEGGKCTAIFGQFTVDTNIGANGTPWCLRSTSSMNTHEVQVRGGKCSEEAHAITFVLTGPGFNCRYTRASAIIGSYTTHSTGDAIITIPAGAASEFTKEPESGILCPNAGRLEASWTLETDTVNTEPLYIS